MIFQTNSELDRVLSLRASSRIPLPPEISLVSGESGKLYREFSEFFRMLGVQDHPMAGLLQERLYSTAVAETLSKASYMDRMMHYSAYTGNEPVKIIDLAGCAVTADKGIQEDDEGGDSEQPSREEGCGIDPVPEDEDDCSEVKDDMGVTGCDGADRSDEVRGRTSPPSPAPPEAL